MITYDQGHWGVGFALKLHGSVFPKSFCWSFPSAVLAVIVHTILNERPELKDAMAAGTVGASVLSGFTFILGFLIVFRSQQAYNRWWEGGTLLQQLRGEWFNAFSSLMAFCTNKKEKSADVVQFQHRLVRLISLLYASAVEQVSTIHRPNLEVLDLDGFDLEPFAFMATSHDRCEVVLQWIQRLIIEADSEQTIKVAPPILSRVYNQLGNGIVNLNNARKITDFPIPFPLAQMVTFMLLMHFFITIIVCAASVDTGAWAGFLAFLVVFSFWSINYIAIELEMPFGEDPNDLPLHEMQSDLNKSLVCLMQKSAQVCPAFRYNPVHAAFRTTETHLDEYLSELNPTLFPQHDLAEADAHHHATLKDLGRKISKRMVRLNKHTEQRKSDLQTKKSEPLAVAQEPDSGSLAAAQASPPVLSSTTPILPSESSTPCVPQERTASEAAVTHLPESALATELLKDGSTRQFSKDGSKEPTTGIGSLPGTARPSGAALSPSECSSADLTHLSKCLEDHLCQIAREVQALREHLPHRMRAAPSLAPDSGVEVDFEKRDSRCSSSI